MLASDLIAKTRLYLSDPPGLRNKVSAHTTGQVTFVNELKNIANGVRFSAGLQTFYVWDALQGTNTAMVDVVEGGSSLLPAGTTVLVNPRYTDFAIMSAINDALTALSSPSLGLFQIKSLTFPYNYARIGYDLTGATDIDSIYEVLAIGPGPFKDWLRIHPSKYRLDRSADPTSFPSGMSLNLWQGTFQGFNVRVVYKAQFGQFVALTDNITAVNLPQTCADVVALGAAINLMSGKEIARNDTQSQGDTRRAGEVPPGAVANSVNGLRLLYQQRIAQEAARLQRDYPSYRGG